MHLCLQHLRGRRLVHTPCRSEELGDSDGPRTPRPDRQRQESPQLHRPLCGHPICGPPVGGGGLPVSLKSLASELRSHSLPTQTPQRAAQEGKAPTDASSQDSTPRDEPLLRHPENYLLSPGHTGHRHRANSQIHTQQPLRSCQNTVLKSSQ